MANSPIVTVEYGPFIFSAAHCLPRAASPDGRVGHWHVWSLWVVCECEVSEETGWGVDEDQMSSRIIPILSLLEGKNLNDVLPMPPTNEAIAVCMLASLPDWADGVRVVRDGVKGECFVTRKANSPDMSKWAISETSQVG
jgi:6-pyruvoyl-tetrahydropterin synthase